MTVMRSTETAAHLGISINTHNLSQRQMQLSMLKASEIARREARARRALRQAGEKLCKSRTCNIHSNDMGGYRILDAETMGCVAGGRFDLDLEDVEAYIENDCSLTPLPSASEIAISCTDTNTH